MRVTFSEDMSGSTINGSTFTLLVGGAPVTGTVTYDGSTRVAAFLPSAGILAEGQSYVAAITSGVTDVAGNALASSFQFTFTTVDNTAPTIVSRSPGSGAINVATNTTVQIGFSEAMNASTINTGTLTLSTGGNGVPGAVTYNPATRVATLTPNSALVAGTTYTVAVTTGVRDSNGNALAGNDSYSFTTVGGVVGDANIGGLSRPGDGGWSGSVGTGNIHVHVIFTQTGQTLSKGAECPQQTAYCFMQPLNQTGQDQVGANSPGLLWPLIQSITGTVNGSQIDFTIAVENGRTFTFAGTASSNFSMTGTISGATLPATSLTLTRPQP